MKNNEGLELNCKMCGVTDVTQAFRQDEIIGPGAFVQELTLWPVLQSLASTGYSNWSTSE